MVIHRIAVNVGRITYCLECPVPSPDDLIIGRLYGNINEKEEYLGAI